MNVLIVDDVELNRMLLESLLEDRNHEVTFAENGKAALEKVKAKTPDLIISDILMPVMDGFQLCRLIRSDSSTQNIPFIFYSATYTEDKDREFARKLGADAFIAKPGDPEEILAVVDRVLEGVEKRSGIIETGTEDVFNLYSERLVNKLEKKMIELEAELTARRRAEESLKDREAYFRTLADSGQALIWVMDRDKKFSYFNQVWLNFTGRTLEEELAGGWRDSVHAEDIYRSRELIDKAYLRHEKINLEIRLRNAAGEYRAMQTSAAPLYDSRGEFLGYVGHCLDVTRRRQLEDQLAHAMKMESVGRLAGGVAHDFNNILQVILGDSELLLSLMDPDDESYGSLLEISKSAARAAELTRQLLVFARKQSVKPRIIDLNSSVESMLKMLRRLIGEDIELVWKPGSQLKSLNMDPGQVDQILANLCVNARDAISGGGQIFIETEQTEIGDDYVAENSDAKTGKYLQLSVTDTGIGMDSNVLKKIFEPFFTTKKEGEGTGLGLSTVYGIVKQGGGFINVYSESGRGTTFKVYLPVFDKGKGSGTGETAVEEPVQGSGETILVVEDEDNILELSRKMLLKLNYNVLTVSSPLDAVSMVEQNGSGIDLVITDVVLPEINGKELSERIRAMHPGIRFLFMSGYTREIISQRGIMEKTDNFIEKPFSSYALGYKIREILK